jgi:hypothetical protein
MPKLLTFSGCSRMNASPNPGPRRWPARYSTCAVLRFVVPAVDRFKPT